MQAKHLEASVRQEPGGTVLDLRGEINGFSPETLDAAYAEAEAKDSKAKRRLLAYGLSEHYVEIFNITRLSDFVGVYPDEETALSEASVS
jgi:hypothetical protein